MKKLLLSIFGIITLGLINFGYCETVDSLIDIIQSNSSVSLPANGFGNIYNVSDSSQLGTYCVKIKTFSKNVTNIQLGYSKNGLNFDNGTQFYSIWEGDIPNLTCFYVWYGYISIGNSFSSTVSDISYDIFRLDSLLDTSLPIMTSLECETEYNLIPVSSVDSNYCEINGLCPLCPDLSGGFSDVFIYSNNRYFPITGTNNIYVNLPSYLGYDYDYSNGGNDLDIDVGMVVDEDYIDGLNAVQNYKPTSDDFTELIGTLTPYSKILIFCLFIFIIWSWIKKSFRSKKL